MLTVRTHVMLPADVIQAIDALVGQRGRSAFLTDVARQEVKRRQLMVILDHPEPIWKAENHPELNHGSAAWVSKTRREEEASRGTKAKANRSRS